MKAAHIIKGHLLSLNVHLISLSLSLGTAFITWWLIKGFPNEDGTGGWVPPALRFYSVGYGYLHTGGKCCKMSIFSVGGIGSSRNRVFKYDCALKT